MKRISITLAFCAAVLSAIVATRADADTPALAWYSPNDSSKIKILGLPWLDQNHPHLWRLPAGVIDKLPKGVQQRSKEPAGSRLLIQSNTTQLALKITSVGDIAREGFDVYLDGHFYKSIIPKESTADSRLILFRDLNRKPREILIYLPGHQEFSIQSIGVDADATFAAPEHIFANPLPIVFYGSSVCQGTGSAKPGMSYEAILCRNLNYDFINLGFGGAGKAEPAVVDLVNSVPACCYVLDLGKSYGSQDAVPFRNMIVALRHSHPDTPIICMTPITSSAEVHSPSYSARSLHDRDVMREPTNALIQAGDKKLYLLEGADLLGFADHDGLSRDGVHPCEYGYAIIAERLLPAFKEAVKR